MVRRSRLIMFYFKEKVLCFGTRRQVNCEMFILSNLVSPVPFDKKNSKFLIEWQK